MSLVWAICPALPALLRGELLGHGLTDLYPSVWALWSFASLQDGCLPGCQEGWPAFTHLLAWPQGQGHLTASPIKGLLAIPLLPVLGLVSTWNALVISARFATVMCAWLAARAVGLTGPGALAAAAVYGCAPFFHGYAVEGLAEGTDGWTLALLALALARGRPLWAAAALALTILSSWYLGLCGCALAAGAAVRERPCALALLGILPTLPVVALFLGAFPEAAPLDPSLRAAMGAQLTVPTPGATGGLQPFAMNTYVGWIVGALALAGLRHGGVRWVALAAVPGALSLGIGPLYELPALELMRFPYRWHALTLLLLAPAVGRVCRGRWAWIIGPLIAVEGLLLSAVEPILPGADPSVPEIYDLVDGPVLELPGPLALPPGVPNPSRERSRQLLYFQTSHGQPSPWPLDFNGLAPAGLPPHLETLRSWDPRWPGTEPKPITPSVLAALRADGVGLIVISREAPGLSPALIQAGATLVADDGERLLLSVGGEGVRAD